MNLTTEKKKRSEVDEKSNKWVSLKRTQLLTGQNNVCKLSFTKKNES